MAADRMRQQNRAADLPFLFGAVQTDGKCNRAQGDAHQDRCRDQHRVPQLNAGDLERSHAGIVHRRDTAGDDGATDPRAVAPVRNQRSGQADAGQQDGGHQRQGRQRDVVAARNSRGEGQHRNEVRCPDAKAGRDRGYRKPRRPHVAGRSTRMAEQVDRGQRCQHANNGGETNQLEIMGVSDAIIDFQHEQTA
jgi:hypothetical protein